MVLRLSGGRRLRSPRGEVARPTTGRVRQAVMNMLAPELRGCRWLELCGGSGVMACEALQRGAAAVVLVEKDRRVAAVARTNLEDVARGLAGAEEGGALAVEVVVEEALRFLGRGTRASGRKRFDLIYADPPWSAGLHGALTRAVAEGGWLAPEGTLILECDRLAPPSLPAGWMERRRGTHGGSLVLLLGQEPALES
ncbi:MAG: RsmD family RNA methyltransferase [Cyanobacteriota bacterium]